MKKMTIFYLIFLIFNSSCGVDDERPPIVDDMGPDCPSYESNHLNIMWQSPLHEDTLFAGSMIPQLLGDNVIFSDLLADNNENLSAFHLENGDLAWTTLDFADNNQGISSSGSVISNGSDLLFSFFLDTYKVNGETGHIDWNYNFDHGGPRTTIIGDYFYYDRHFKNGQATIKSQLCRTALDSPDWKVVFEKDRHNNFEPNFEPPSLFINNSGDSILIFQNRSWNFQSGINKGKVDLFAFNLNSNQLAWELEDVTLDGNSSVHPPIIHNDRVYFQGANSMHCLDAETGEEIWSRQILGESFFRCPNIIVGNKLIANGTTDHIYAFDLDTGDIVWDNPFTGSTVPNMDHYNGIIYFGSMGDGKLRGVRASDGILVLETNSPNEICDSGASFSGGVVIDQESGYLYTHDKFFAMCIDLN